MTPRKLSFPKMGLMCVALGCLCLSGCSLMLMGQRMFFGDPLIKSEFKTFTHVDLTKGKHKLMVLCTTPNAIDEELSTLNLDVIDGVTRQLKREGVDVIDPDLIANWLDRHGGLPEDLSELVQEKKMRADYIALIEVQSFSYREESSADLLRGRSRGFLHVYRVDKLDEQWMATSVFKKEFTSVYPTHQPISELSRSSEIFRREFTQRLSDQLAHKFYDYREGWEI